MTIDGTKGTVAIFGSYAPSLILFRAPLISALTESGYRVAAIAPKIDQVANELAKLGAVAIDVPIANASLNPAATLASYRAVSKAIRDIAPVAVISYTIKPVTLGSIAAWRAGVPKVVALVTGLGFAFTSGGGAKRRLSRFAAKAMYWAALRRCSAILFQNADDRDHFVSLGLVRRGDNVAIINGSGIDVEAFVPAPFPARLSFLMISRLLGDKGVREYGKAALHLKKRFPDVSFKLVGYFDESPDRISESELTEMIAGGVEFVGRLEDVRPAIAECSVYVLPSYREGTPRSVLEAMAMGRPVITTDAPGCRETVEPGRNGFLVEPRTVEPLARAMEKFIEDPSLIPAMGAESRTIAESKYDARAVNRTIMQVSGL
jgi:glycosyltransferase involved in cell wall biosynthesis